LAEQVQTLRCLHALQNAGILEQRLDAEYQVRWHLAKGGEKKFKRLKRELGIAA
jgi:DNA-binding IclR family transcriptional regulator